MWAGDWARDRYVIGGLRMTKRKAHDIEKKLGQEWACKPGSVTPLWAAPVTIYLGRRLLAASSDLPGCR